MKYLLMLLCFFAISCIPAFAMIDEADKIMGAYFQKACANGLERAGLYITSRQEFIDLSVKSMPNKVYEDITRTRKILTDESGVIAAHCHCITYDSLLLLPDFPQEHVRAVTTVGKARVESRMYLELPSYDFDSDMHMAIQIEFEIFKHHESPTIEHRIYIIRNDSDPQVVAYGLSPRYQRKLRTHAWKYAYAEQEYMVYATTPFYKFVPHFRRRARRYGDRMERYTRRAALLHSKMIEEYFELTTGYVRDHCQMWTIGECNEPSITELFDRINDHRYFFVEDRGYVHVE